MLYRHRYRDWVLVIALVLMAVLVFVVPQDVRASYTSNAPNTNTSFTSISVGSNHTCALTNTGAVYCWGLNDKGQLGDGTNTNRATPVAVRMPVGVTTTSISAGAFHTCALTSAGAVYCWGHNYYGELGDGTGINRTTPVAVNMPDGVTSFASISVGAYHTCALASSGTTIYCWGWNIYGQLGSGTLSQIAIIAAINAGGYHNCVLTSAGAVNCWGYNWSGQLGDGTNTNRSTPVAVIMP